jgi:hypothetical protein
MDPEQALREARRNTCVAIADLASKKYQLETLRTDRDASPHHISDAAQAFRSAETTVHDMVQKEIEAVTKLVAERANAGNSNEVPVVDENPID